jgi:uncharacterized membrane protein
MEERDYRERLARDVPKWRSEGIIDERQEARILARYGAGDHRTVEALRLGWLVTVVSIIGALVLGGGVILMFAANWEEMPDWFRTASVIAGMLVAYGAGYALIFRYDMQRVGSAVLLLGVVLFISGVFLVAQIYNMSVDSTWLYLIVAAGVLPVAYAFGSRIVLLIGIGAGVSWVIAEIVQRYEDTSKFEASLVIIGVFGIAVYAIGRLHGVRAALVRYGEVYMFAGTLITLSLVYLFTFIGLWDTLIEDGVESYASPAGVYVSIIVAVVLVTAALWVARDERDSAIEAAALLGMLAIAGVVATWPAWTGYALIFNVIFFGAGVGFIARGYTQSDERFVNFGLAIVALGLMTRYVDFFWSMMAGSAFFIIGGVLLLAGAFAAERFRRGLLEAMNGGPNDGEPSGGAATQEATA